MKAAEQLSVLEWAIRERGAPVSVGAASPSSRVPDARWPSTNREEIPDLVLSRGPVGLDLPLEDWGHLPRSGKMLGTWHFYVDDYRFKMVWDRPDQVVDTACLGVVEPNYSVFAQTPYPIALWATYRKRWLARYWQERGLAVWVDLNVAEEHAELNLIGVPNGWRWFATRGYEDRVDDLRREHALATEQAGGEPILIVYGSSEAVKRVCEELPGAMFFPARRAEHTGFFEKERDDGER